MTLKSLALSLITLVSFLPIAQAQLSDTSSFPKLKLESDWPWWRGPSRDGHAATNSKLPTKFGDNENVRWKVPVPGRGHSSPIVVGDKVFLATADEQKQIQSAIAFDRSTGKQLWQVELNQGGFPKNNHAKNTEASPTIGCDGNHLFVTFFNHKAVQLSSLTLDGKKEWQKSLGTFDPKQFEYGYAPSPLLYNNSVIIVAEHDGDSWIVAVERDSGNEIWRTPRIASISFSSPVIANVAGREQILISGTGTVTSYDPASGKQLWQCRGPAIATCGTVVWDKGLVFASGGFPESATIAVQADGSSKLVWRNGQKSYEQSMLVVDGYLYALTDKGVVYCWRCQDGEEMWRERLSGPVSASGILANGLIYWANEAGSHYVFKANPQKFELIAENRLGNSSFASPAVAGNELFLRVGVGEKPDRQEFLYCIAQE